MFKKSNLAMKGKFNLRAVLGSGPLKKLTIDDIQADSMIAAAAIDTFTMIMQNCKSVVLYDCINDTVKIPEIIVRNCLSVEFPSCIECTVMTVTNSTLKANNETNRLMIDGDVVLDGVKFEGYEKIVINGTIYADSMTLQSLEPLDITCINTIDIGGAKESNSKAS